MKKIKTKVFFSILILIAINAFDSPICKLVGQKYPAHLFLSIRYFIAFILLVPFSKFGIKNINYSLISAILVYLLGNCSSYKALAYGMDISTHNFFESLIPYISCLFACLFIKESIKFTSLVGITISFIIYLFIFYLKGSTPNLSFEFTKISLVFSLFSAICYSLNNVIMKISTKKIEIHNYKNLLGIVFWNSFFGFIFNFICFLLLEKNKSENHINFAFFDVIIFAYFSIMMTLVYNYILYFMLSNMKIQKFLAYISLYPVFSSIIASVIFDESITIKLFICFALSLVGIFVVNSDYKIKFKKFRPKDYLRDS